MQPRLIVGTDSFSVTVNNKEATHSPAENMEILKGAIDSMLRKAAEVLGKKYPPTAAN